MGKLTKVAPKEGKMNKAQAKVIKTEGKPSRPSARRGSHVGNETSADMKGALEGHASDKMPRLGRKG